MALTKKEIFVALSNGEKIRDTRWDPRLYIELDEGHNVLVNHAGFKARHEILDHGDFEIWREPIRYCTFEEALQDMYLNNSRYSLELEPEVSAGIFCMIDGIFMAGNKEVGITFKPVTMTSIMLKPKWYKVK
jgi:hypothetical protein